MTYWLRSSFKAKREDGVNDLRKRGRKVRNCEEEKFEKKQEKTRERKRERKEKKKESTFVTPEGETVKFFNRAESPKITSSRLGRSSIRST